MPPLEQIPCQLPGPLSRTLPPHIGPLSCKLQDVGAWHVAPRTIQRERMRTLVATPRLVQDLRGGSLMSEPPGPAPAASSPLSVLVIDDEKNIRTTLAMCLESARCRVVAAGSGEAALAAAERQRFDLAFLDLRL